MPDTYSDYLRNEMLSTKYLYVNFKDVPSEVRTSPALSEFKSSWTVFPVQLSLKELIDKSGTLSVNRIFKKLQKMGHFSTALKIYAVIVTKITMILLEFGFEIRLCA